ncbi:hypothetical protein JHD50_09400 [Sulfurimonas sp. MAG313]|nr:hypothetical protein [Sulfurimonas sp. MAG313]MDF1881513.1 hypothetical protein [Sulfurimonas sp. MAG313]
MQNILDNLSKRRKIMFYILVCITLIALIIDYTFDIPISSYFEEKNNTYIIAFLLTYKVLELGILYLVFYRRHLYKLLLQPQSDELLKKFEKNGKRFFMLVPHGSTIFAIISYKLSANIFIFLSFMLIASIALFLVKPSKHNEI